MSKRKTQSKLSYIPRMLISVLVLCIFIFPIYSTGKWIHDAVVGNDPRKIHELTTFNTRPADKTHEEIAPFNEALISITFDDGWESAYSAGLPTMQKYGVKTTQYILAGEFNNPAYLSMDQTHALQDAGHEIASHTMTHPNLTKLSDKDLNFQLVKSKKILEKEFGPIKDFASPLGEHNGKTVANIKKSYRSDRNTAGDPAEVGPEDVNTKDNFNQYDIIAYTVRANTPLEYIDNLITYAQAHNAWVVLTYHQIDNNSNTEEYSVSPAAFEAQMKLLYERQIRMQMMGQVLDAIEKTKKGHHE